jgi:hypothetical protein
MHAYHVMLFTNVTPAVHHCYTLTCCSSLPHQLTPPPAILLFVLRAAAAVVPGLLDAMAAAEGDGDAELLETWRRRLFNYLDKVFMVSIFWALFEHVYELLYECVYACL